jgi:hypothetical protein
MDKDPAFLFYSKDWIEGTAEMSPEAKGVLIDLMAHQHQKKSIPADIKKLARLCALSEGEFLRIWEAEVKEKFQPDGDRLVNRKLTVVMTERLEKGRRNKVIGTLASIIRLSPEPFQKKAEAKKGFKVEDFLTIPDHQLTERLTEWFQQRLKSIEDANGNANGNGDNKGGVGETPASYGDERFLVPKMLACLKKEIPEYPDMPELDGKALFSIAQFLCQRGNLRGDPSLHAEKVIEAWEHLCAYIASDSFYRQKSLKTIANGIQEIIQKAINGDKSKPASQKGSGKFDEDKLKAGVRARVAERQQGAG